MKRFGVFFVWVRGLNGVVPLRVCANHEDEPRVGGSLDKRDILASHQLHKHEETLNFPQLEKLYPPPKEACS